MYSVVRAYTHIGIIYSATVYAQYTCAHMYYRVHACACVLCNTTHMCVLYSTILYTHVCTLLCNRIYVCVYSMGERWGAGVETQKNVRGEIGGWGRVPFNEPYAPSLSNIYDGA